MRNLAMLRYAFERWLESAYNLTDTDRDRATGEYSNPHTALAFAAFKAGRAYIGPKAEDVPAGTQANASA
jgi:hypothetical protein